MYNSHCSVGIVNFKSNKFSIHNSEEGKFKKVEQLYWSLPLLLRHRGDEIISSCLIHIYQTPSANICKSTLGVP